MDRTKLLTERWEDLGLSERVNAMQAARDAGAELGTVEAAWDCTWADAGHYNDRLVRYAEGIDESLREEWNKAVLHGTDDPRVAAYVEAYRAARIGVYAQGIEYEILSSEDVPGYTSKGDTIPGITLPDVEVPAQRVYRVRVVGFGRDPETPREVTVTANEESEILPSLALSSHQDKRDHRAGD